MHFSIVFAIAAWILCYLLEWSSIYGENYELNTGLAISFGFWLLILGNPNFNLSSGDAKYAIDSLLICFMELSAFNIDWLLIYD